MGWESQNGSEGKGGRDKEREGVIKRKVGGRETGSGVGAKTKQHNN